MESSLNKPEKERFPVGSGRVSPTRCRDQPRKETWSTVVRQLLRVGLRHLIKPMRKNNPKNGSGSSEMAKHTSDSRRTENG